MGSWWALHRGTSAAAGAGRTGGRVIARSRRTIAAIAAIGGLLAATAGDLRAEETRVHGSLQVLGGFPAGEFGDEVTEEGIGLSLDAGLRPGRGPLVFGARVGFVTYGRTQRKEPFNPNIPEVTIEVETTNNLVLGHLYLRLQPPRGAIRPYVDGLLGFGYLYTESQVQSEQFDEEIATSKNFDDTVLSYGIGGGLHILLGKMGNEDEGQSIRGIFLDLGGEYLVGGEGRYLEKGSVRRVGDPPVLVFDVKESKTDVATAKLGVAVEF